MDNEKKKKSPLKEQIKKEITRLVRIISTYLLLVAVQGFLDNDLFELAISINDFLVS